MKRMAMAFAFPMIALMLLTTPREAASQQADGWWEWALPALIEARGDDGAVLGRQDRGRGSAANARNARRGPPFCQNGQGHPVHGRQWCRDKGFGLGGGILDSRWDVRGWDDVVLRAPRAPDRRQGVLDHRGLIDILGDVVYGRVAAEGSRMGAREPLTGRWVRADGAAAVLQVRSGSLRLAELTDLDGDGRVDAVLISRR